MLAEGGKRSSEFKKDGNMEKCIKTERSVLEFYTTKSNPNRMEGWWSRMEAEGRRDKEKQNLNPVWIKKVE